MLQPIDELFDQRVDAGAAGIEPDVRLFVCRAALIIQGFEPGAIGRERPAAVGRDPADQPIQGNVEPDRHPVAVDGGPILTIREGATAGCHDDMPRERLFGQNLPLRRPEVGLAVLRENLADGHVLPLFDQLVDVDRLPVEPFGERARLGSLAGGHEANQVHLVSLHDTSRSSVRKKSG